MMTAFHKWVDFHGKEYASHEEKMTRLQIWAENNGKWDKLQRKVAQGRILFQIFLISTDDYFGINRNAPRFTVSYRI